MEFWFGRGHAHVYTSVPLFLCFNYLNIWYVCHMRFCEKTHTPTQTPICQPLTIDWVNMKRKWISNRKKSIIISAFFTFSHSFFSRSSLSLSTAGFHFTCLNQSTAHIIVQFQTSKNIRIYLRNSSNQKQFISENFTPTILTAISWWRKKFSSLLYCRCCCHRRHSRTLYNIIYIAIFKNFFPVELFSIIRIDFYWYFS